MTNVDRLIRELEAEAAEALRLREERRAREQKEREAQEALKERLEGLGYEVHTGRTSAGNHEAVAFYGGRMVGYGWGGTPLEALRSLAGDLGVEAP